LNSESVVDEEGIVVGVVLRSGYAGWGRG